jgi:hypothetical protein
MTELSDKPTAPTGWPDSAANLVHTGDWYGAPDARLQWMADTADTFNIGVGITLVVPGGTISGVLVSAQEFFTTSGETFRGNFPDDPESHDAFEALAKSFFDVPAEMIAREVKDCGDAFEKGEREEPRWPLVRHIHLRDARFSVPGQQYHLPLGHTRILLSQVVAWVLGQRWCGEG